MATEDIIDLAKKLIAIPSTEDSHTKLKEIISFSHTQLTEFTAQEFISNGKPSLLVHNAKKDTKHFNIILNAHLDVVPGKKPQFEPVVKDGRLYGRGAYDMKAASAVMLLLFKAMAKKANYTLALQLVTDEEIGGHHGTKYQVEKGITADFVIAGEFTKNEIRHKAKGPLWLKIKTFGTTSHAAYPWLGKNALVHLQSLLEKIVRHYPVPPKPSWQTTVNIAKIETENNTFNRVPDEATAWLDIRVIPEEEEIVLDNIKKILGNEAEIEIVMHEKPAYTDPHHPHIKKLQKLIKEVTQEEAKVNGANGASDVRFYNTMVNVPGIEFGPVGDGAHSDSEWVSIESLDNYYRILKQFLLSFK